MAALGDFERGLGLVLFVAEGNIELLAGLARGRPAFFQPHPEFKAVLGAVRRPAASLADFRRHSFAGAHFGERGLRRG